MKKKIRIIISLLERAYNCNIKAHEWATWYYKHKSETLIYVCKYIKKNNLPFKYGRLKDENLNSSIIYFEYQWKQLSFHDFSKKLRKIKIYNWTWSWVINYDFPF